MYMNDKLINNKKKIIVLSIILDWKIYEKNMNFFRSDPDSIFHETDPGVLSIIS